MARCREPWACEFFTSPAVQLPAEASTTHCERGLAPGQKLNV